MAPDHPDHDLLSLHVTGRLVAADQARFRQHLASCAECQAELAFLDDVKDGIGRNGAAFLEDHPTPDRLVGYVRGELDSGEAARVRGHIELCSTCSAESRWISGEAAGVADRPRAGTRWGWAAAIAAAVVVGVAVPLLLAVFRPDARVSFFTPQFVGQSELGQGDRNVVTLRQGEQRWTAYFPIDAAPADFPCSVEFVNDKGDSIVRTTVTGAEELAGGQYLFLECSPRDCPPGSYTLRVESSSGRPLESIAFRVESR